MRACGRAWKRRRAIASKPSTIGRHCYINWSKWSKRSECARIGRGGRALGRSKGKNTRVVRVTSDTCFGSAQLHEEWASVRYGTLIAGNYSWRFYSSTDLSCLKDGLLNQSERIHTSLHV